MVDRKFAAHRERNNGETPPMSGIMPLGMWVPGGRFPSRQVTGRQPMSAAHDVRFARGLNLKRA
jgi:hypothetical protein